MPLKIESSGSTISLRAQIGSVRWIFLGVPLLAWSQGNLKLDGSGRFVSYLVAFLFVTLGLLVGLQPSIESTFDLAAKVIRIRRRTAIAREHRPLRHRRRSWIAGIRS
jgi:hypothetical protein